MDKCLKFNKEELLNLKMHVTRSCNQDFCLCQHKLTETSKILGFWQYFCLERPNGQKCVTNLLCSF